jgi:FHA domain-containing protein
MTTGGCGTRHDGGPGYCPECGLLRGGPTAPAASCTACGAASDGGTYCEQCGQPLTGEAAPDAVPRAPAVVTGGQGWFAVVSADRSLFDAVRGAARGFVFPTLAERRVALVADVNRIGRSGRTGRDPEVDLCGPPPDPGVSREHAELLRQADDGWALRDCGSSNGTFLGSRRLPAGGLVPIAAGDTVRLGVWSRIVIVRDG